MLGMIARPYSLIDSAGASNATFPKANLINNDYGRVGRTTSGAVMNYNWDYDLGVARPVDTIAVLWHNLRSGDTINIFGGTAQGGSDVYNSGVLPAITGTSNRDTPGPAKFLLTPSSTPTARYWRVRFGVVGTAHPDGFVQASRLFIGKRTIFQIGPQRAELGGVDLNQKIQLENGEERASEDSLLIRPTAQLDLRYAKETEMAEVLGKYTLGLGTSLPMMVVPDLTAAALQDMIVFGRPDAVMSLQSEIYDVWQFQARVRSLGP